jgi:hypothetical protein
MSYSKDLRVRVIRAVENGEMARGAARHFVISSAPVRISGSEVREMLAETHSPGLELASVSRVVPGTKPASGRSISPVYFQQALQLASVIMLSRGGTGLCRDLDALASPARRMPEKQDAPKRPHAFLTTEEMIKSSERELNILIQAAAEKIAHTRDLIAKLDQLLAKRL